MKKTAEQNLIDFLRENHDWFSSGDLQRKMWSNKDGTIAAPRTIVRRLQENTYHETDNPKGILEVEYRDKNHAFYRVRKEHRKLKQIVTLLPNGSVKIEYL